MEPELFPQMAALEDRHWWFTARRSLLTSELRRIPWPEHAEILEIGCGTGGNLAMLSQFGQVRGLESEPAARELARAKQPFPVDPGALPEDLPYAKKAFDGIAMLDVLEHIQDDRAALRAVRRVLRPTGFILLSVPALPWLWSGHDEAHHHFRRYTRASLEAMLRDAGWQPTRIRYFNSLLLPLIVLARAINRWRGTTGSDLTLPAPPLNFLFHQIFAAERFCPRWCAFPAGASLLAVARPLSENDHG